MSKNLTAAILPSENEGWDVWTKESGVVTHQQSTNVLTDKIDAQEVRFALSATQYISLPVSIPSNDSAMVSSAAQLELDGAGLGEVAEGTWDVLTLEQSEEHTFATAVQLLEETLNYDAPLHFYQFDIAARYYKPDAEGDCIALWKEHGKWCLSLYRKRAPFLIESIDGPSKVTSNLPMLIAQLSYRGIDFQPTQAFLWSDFAELEQLTEQFERVGLNLQSSAKPQPHFPEELVKLRPSSVSAWEEKMKRKGRVRSIALAVAAVYLVLLGLCWWKFQQAGQKVAVLEKDIQSFAPQWEANQEHFDNWDALFPVVTEDWPLVMYRECVMSLPNGQQIRFTVVDISNGAIQLQGEANNTSSLNAFRARLKKSKRFAEFDWEMQPEKQSQKTKQWEFNYTAKPKVYEGA